MIIHCLGLKIKLFNLHNFWNNAINIFTAVQDMKNLVRYQISKLLSRYDFLSEKISEALSFHALSENQCHNNTTCSYR